jgi:alkanesulfonate monooxygenase SsuD/methylene tetrahydromethanopterin reductase-like flavin-dependent oxidoreductase (luciferase family)
VTADARRAPAPARARRGIFLAPFDELADVHLLADLAARAEARGWDGVFLWDHIAYDPPVRAVLDPWVALSAIACATERIRLGPLVTPVPRRRVQKLAREIVTLDHLCGGRLVFGAGLGGDRGGELSRWGEEMDRRARADLLDRGLERLEELSSGDFEPAPVQRPRVPIWIAAVWPNRRPVRRAARWDGIFPIDLPGPDALAPLAEELTTLRGSTSAPFDIVVTSPPGTDPTPWEAAGATWCLTGFGSQPDPTDVTTAIDTLPKGV